MPAILSTIATQISQGGSTNIDTISSKESLQVPLPIENNCVSTVTPISTNNYTEMGHELSDSLGSVNRINFVTDKVSDLIGGKKDIAVINSQMVENVNLISTDVFGSEGNSASGSSTIMDERIVCVPTEHSNSETMEEKMEFLRSVVVNDRSLSEIRKKLKETVQHRLQLMKIPELDLLEQFPFFFTHSNLVKYIYFFSESTKLFNNLAVQQ